MQAVASAETRLADLAAGSSSDGSPAGSIDAAAEGITALQAEVARQQSRLASLQQQLTQARNLDQAVTTTAGGGSAGDAAAAAAEQRKPLGAGGQPAERQLVLRAAVAAGAADLQAARQQLEQQLEQVGCSGGLLKVHDHGSAAKRVCVSHWQNWLPHKRQAQHKYVLAQPASSSAVLGGRVHQSSNNATTTPL